MGAYEVNILLHTRHWPRLASVAARNSTLVCKVADSLCPREIGRCGGCAYDGCAYDVLGDQLTGQVTLGLMEEAACVRACRSYNGADRVTGCERGTDGTCSVHTATILGGGNLGLLVQPILPD